METVYTIYLTISILMESLCPYDPWVRLSKEKRLHSVFCFQFASHSLVYMVHFERKFSHTVLDRIKNTFNVTQALQTTRVEQIIDREPGIKHRVQTRSALTWEDTQKFHFTKFLC
ncbi:hypothetical protein XENORESO_000795 [Xenotaenia resolanae]|uniref:Uncharacterized protein n=1 Tax=Xenotaenia resolanae TaxID=208358 RepID=A0ABV0WC36_9TELE